MSTIPILEVQNLVKDYVPNRLFAAKSKNIVRAVDGVSFSLEKGKTLSIVGESGSGKSTLARMVMHLIEPTSGEVFINGKTWASKGRKEEKELRQRIQLIFQDPFSSINPRMRIREIIAEPLINF